jgi:hypothetical protein
MMVVNNGALLSSYGGAVGSIIRPASFVVRRRSALGGNSVVDSSFQKSVVSTSTNLIFAGGSRYCYSTFVPPPNNVYNGPAPAYPNIDITSKSKVDGSSAASARNDPSSLDFFFFFLNMIID